MMGGKKGGIALLLGGMPDEESDDMDAEMACKAFFRAGMKGNHAKALEAFKALLEACGVEEYDGDDESMDSEESEDEGDDY